MAFARLVFRSKQSLTSFAFCTLFSCFSFASTVPASQLEAGSNGWADSRAQYQIALKHLNKGKNTQFNSYRHQLEADSYPLAPYLTYYDYRRNLASVPDEEIMTFIDENWDSPISEQLKQSWLKQLATAKNWDAFIQHFVPEEDAKNDELLCNQARAWLNKAQIEQAFKAAEKLWLVGRSQSNSCDPLFKAWQNAGLLTDDLVWQRLELAMHQSNIQLARFLSRQLKSETLKKDFIIWESLFASPHHLAGKLDDFTDTPRHRNIILHVLTRWVRSDKPNTLYWLQQFSQKYHFTQAEKDTHISYVARYISFTFNPQSKYWLMEVDMTNKDRQVGDKRMEVALRAEDWPAVILWSMQPAHSVWEQSKLDYWQARAFEALANTQSQRLITNRWPSVNTDNILYIHRLMRAALSTELGAEYIAMGNDYQPYQAWRFALKHYENLSGLRDFYGFLSSEKLNRALSLNHKLRPVQPSLFHQVQDTPGFQRARELYTIDQKYQAYREWRHTLDRLPLEHKGIAARVAESWGWNYQAIVTASSSDEQNNLELRFPTKYKDAVAYQSQKNQIDTGWVYSVIRQESAFRAEARSGVGAMGLMQLMPGTAKHVARNIGLTPPKTEQLLTADFNIQLGSNYLRELYDEFDQNIVMATAAYNAGPHRVKEWRPSEAPIAGDIWIETIPFKETREYVKNILTYQAIYKFRMGLIASLSEDIQTIKPKQTMPIIQLPTQLVRGLDKD